MMKFYRLSFVFFFLGCGLALHGSQEADAVKKLGLGVQGHLIVSEIFADAQTVQVALFSPGVHVEASEKFDQSSLVIMRGVIDGINEAGRFRVLDHGGTEQPDLMIIGRVVRFDVQDHWKRFIGGSRKRLIEVDGRVVGRQGDTVAVFSSLCHVRYQDMSEIDFLLKTGRAVGVFLSQQ